MFLGSQRTPSEQLDLLPGAAKYLKSNGYRGDYLNILKRFGRDEELVGPFKRNWEKLNKQKSKSEEKLPLYNTLVSEIPMTKEIPDMEELGSLIEFLRSDHARFWVANTTEHKSLNAVLLTDTGEFIDVIEDF